MEYYSYSGTEQAIAERDSGNLNPGSPPWASCIIFQEKEKCRDRAGPLSFPRSTKTSGCRGKKELLDEQLSSTSVLCLSSNPPRLSLFLSRCLSRRGCPLFCFRCALLLSRLRQREDICFRVRSDGNSSVDSPSRKIYARIFARRCSQSRSTYLPPVSHCLLFPPDASCFPSPRWLSRPVNVRSSFLQSRRAATAGSESATNENNVFFAKRNETKRNGENFRVHTPAWWHERAETAEIRDSLSLSLTGLWFWIVRACRLKIVCRRAAPRFGEWNSETREYDARNIISWGDTSHVDN